MSSGRYAPTKAALSRRLGISYYTLIQRFGKLPDRPRDHSPGSARYDVEAWHDFIQARKSAHNFGHNGNNGFGPSERDKAIIEQKRIATEREKFKLDVERGKYELKDDVVAAITRNITALFRELDKAFRHELPPRFEGLSAGDIAKMSGRKLNELRERLAQAFP
jgi:hypothetical protein